ncbi:hypothetical protein BECAL_02319 [Bellilinea caldifistulae]|jgi:hypothetical protein|nr:hypothetical protein [Bellilinea caldifistulae]GAP11134.1 hypothetical protein BECAL_02319 [Bellilinea caldifistulae]
MINLVSSVLFTTCLVTAWFAANNSRVHIKTDALTVVTTEAVKYALGMVEYILSYPGVYLLACLVMVFILTVSGVGLSFIVWLREE